MSSDPRYNNPTLDRIDDLINKMGLLGATMALDGATIYVCFNNKAHAQQFGRFIRKTAFEEVTLRRQGEGIWVMTADAKSNCPVEKKDSG